MEVCASDKRSRISDTNSIFSDIHTRNVAFAIPASVLTCDDELSRRLGAPELGHVKRLDGEPLEQGKPRYIVRPSSFPIDSSNLSETVKIVDFGEAFFDADPPTTLRTPLVVRAPEVLLGDQLNHRVELWGMGCLVRCKLGFHISSGKKRFANHLSSYSS